MAIMAKGTFSDFETHRFRTLVWILCKKIVKNAFILKFTFAVPTSPRAAIAKSFVVQAQN